MNLAEFVYTVLLKPPPLRAVANAVLRKLIPQSVGVRGARVFLNPTDPVVCGALALGLYENDEIAFFVRTFRPGMTFVDIGANVGLYSALAAVSGAGRIFAIEPHRETFSFLQKTLSANPCAGIVSSENLAAGSAPGTGVLFSNSQNKGDNRLYPDPMLDQQERIQIESLDALCAAQGITTIDFLKIDVQGAELTVLEGAREVLSHSPQCILLTEFWPQGLARCGSDPAQYLAMLKQAGFSLSELAAGGQEKPVDPAKLLASTQGRNYRNLIARRNDGENNSSSQHGISSSNP